MGSERTSKDNKDSNKRQERAQQTESDTFEAEPSSSSLDLSPANILHLQRTIGNKALQRILSPTYKSTNDIGIQREPEQSHRDALDSDYKAAVRGGFWQLAAEFLNGFNDEDIASRLKTLNHKQLQNLKIGALKRMPGWSSRVTIPLDNIDPEAGRVGQLIFNYNTAVSARNWEEAAKLLNGFNDEDIRVRLREFNPAELTDLKNAALKVNGLDRVVKPLDELLSRFEGVTTGPGKGPVKIASGKDAIRGLNMLTGDASPLTINGGAMGQVTLVPGAANGNRILVSATPLTVYYIDGNDLYKAYTPDFVKDMWMSAFVQGVAKAQWLVPIIKAEMAFIEALIAPWYVMLGIGILKGVIFYCDNKEAIRYVALNLQTMNNLRGEIKQRYPEMYDTVFWACLKEVLLDMPEGIEAEDVAYLLGRILGFQGVLGKVEAGIEVTLKVFLKIVAEYAILVSIIHAPSVMARGLEHALATEAKELQQRLSEAGINIDEKKAKKIVDEIRNDPDGQTLIKQAQQSAQQVQEPLKKLQAISKKYY